MKLKYKIPLFIVLSILLLTFFCLVYYFLITCKYQIDLNKFEKDTNVVYFDDNNEQIKIESKKDFVPYEDIPENLINAFISIEDKRFFSHNGVDYRSILRAVVKNVKSFKAKEGASTITQQLIKNTYLTNEKTINRKLIEISLAKKLEKKLTKKEILEKYLNTIYFGDNCFGISSASEHYFSKETKDLTLSECATLAGLVKSPFYYSPTKNFENSNKRKNVVLNEMYKQNFITESELSENISKEIVLSVIQQSKNKNFEYMLFRELDKILEENNIKNKNIKIYTTLNSAFQNKIEENLYTFDVCDSKSAIIISKNGEIKAYSSNLGEVNRQIGSTIKPLLVYAPAFEHNVIDEVTILDDKKTTFDGYVPQNYKDIYLGKITAKEALSKSSNVCATDVLQSVGIENAKKTVKNLPLNLKDEDKNLNIALGSTTEGTTLKNITACYDVFLNDGIYIEPFTVKEIKNENNITIYKNQSKKQRIFGEETAFLINNCLNDCVKNGTSKKLKSISENLCAKTGTVGNEKGNMDAYSVCYTKDYISSVWFGNENGKLMENNVTGGNFPTITNREIIKETICEKNVDFFDVPKSVSLKTLDKISLYEDKKIELASSYTPKRYETEGYFKNNHLPNVVSTRFLSPFVKDVKTLVNNNVFSVSLCVAEYYNYRIISINENKESIIYDSKINGRNTTINFEINKETDQEFYLIPYCDNREGEKIFLAKIKSPDKIPGDWWLN